jgi:hypothetical protein
MVVFLNSSTFHSSVHLSLYVWKSGGLKPSTLFFFKIVLPLWLLWLPMEILKAAYLELSNVLLKFSPHHVKSAD